ncbi:MAG: tRNA lysidine(34) synthetase TilS, partial [Bacteroidales bacterium]|nr:tRNA lysidine(34) synthetase TilS [Bacteroidales bacterium]
MSIDFYTFASMKDLFLAHLKDAIPLSDTLLLAVSGGVDSMVMFDLFLQTDIRIGVAHCNFQLRGEDSFEDEKLVFEECTKHHIPIHVIRFETKDYAKQHGLSIQMAARELRYNWFEQIRQTYNYNHIATAHHGDDSIETFLLNMLRKTGISGLHGIKEQTAYIIRPMLFTDKEEIMSYAKAHNISFREDSSNANDYYQRNYIRRHIIPAFKKLNPNFTKTFRDSIAIISKQEIVYKTHIQQTIESLLIKENDAYIIEIKKIQPLFPLDVYLFECLHPFGFNGAQVSDLIHCLGTKEEKIFISPTHKLLKTRDKLKIISTIQNEIISTILNKPDKELFRNSGILMETKDNGPDFSFEKDRTTAYFDLEKITFPLRIRTWKQGDIFYPFGGKGKKKLSDFFSDKKL